MTLVGPCFLAGCLIITMASVASCRHSAPSAAAKPNVSDHSKHSPGRPGEGQIYRLTGVIRRIEKDSGLVTIRHDAIPGVIGASTMPFTISDRATLNNPSRRRRGGRVAPRSSDSEGVEESYRLEGLVTAPARSAHTST